MPRFKVGQIWEHPSKGAIRIVSRDGNSWWGYLHIIAPLSPKCFQEGSSFALSLKLISDGCAEAKEDSPRNSLSVQEELTELKAAVSDLKDEVYGRNCTDAAQLSNKTKAAVNLSSYKEEIRGLKQDLYNLRNNYDASRQNNKEWREANLHLSATLNILKENYQDLQVNYDSSVRANGHLCEQNSTLTRQLEQLKDQNHTLLRNYETFQDEHNILTENYQELQDDYTDLNEKFSREDFEEGFRLEK